MRFIYGWSLSSWDLSVYLGLSIDVACPLVLMADITFSLRNQLNRTAFNVCFLRLCLHISIWHHCQYDFVSLKPNVWFFRQVIMKILKRIWREQLCRSLIIWKLWDWKRIRKSSAKYERMIWEWIAWECNPSPD